MKAWKQTGLAAATALAFFVAQNSFAGPDWVEDGDAGNRLDSAQQVTHSGDGTQITHIIGSLTGAASVLSGIPEDDFDDMYQIMITDPMILMFSTVDTSTDFQTSLWLFDVEGHGLLGNIFTPGSIGAVAGANVGSSIENFSTDRTGIVITEPGVYYICISSVDRRPINDNGPIFFFSSLDEVSGPDNEGGSLSLGGWSGVGVAGSYDLVMHGVGIVPAPGALALLGLGMLGVARRRRCES